MLYSFFNIGNKFYHDADYNTRIIKESKQFSQFMVHEFSSENLLFVINIIQFKQFLIENNYTDEIFWKNYRFCCDLKDFINPTNSIEKLIRRHEKWVENSNCENKSSLGADPELQTSKWEIVIPFLRVIFYKFINMHKAPFEVNIPYLMREKATKHFQSIVGGDELNHNSPQLDEAMLLNCILPDLIAICKECMSMVEFSWMRYSPKRN